MPSMAKASRRVEEHGTGNTQFPQFVHCLTTPVVTKRLMLAHHGTCMAILVRLSTNSTNTAMPSGPYCHYCSTRPALHLPTPREMAWAASGSQRYLGMIINLWPCSFETTIWDKLNLRNAQDAVSNSKLELARTILGHVMQLCNMPPLPYVHTHLGTNNIQTQG